MKDCIPDIHIEAPRHRIPLDRVGVSGIKTRLKICSDECRDYDVRLDIYVDLSPDKRGIHISRLADCLRKCLLGYKHRSFKDFLWRLASIIFNSYPGIEHVEISLSTIDYTNEMKPHILGCRVYREKSGEYWEEIYLVLEGLTACPCAQSVYSYFERTPLENTPTHTQRTRLEVWLRAKKLDVDTKELVNKLQDSFSAPLEPVLKRIEEYELLKKAYSRPRFAEDVARETLHIIKEIIGNTDQEIHVHVRVESYDSIHQYNIVAETSYRYLEKSSSQ